MDNGASLRYLWWNVQVDQCEQSHAMDYNSYAVGLGGDLPGLNTALRPANMLRLQPTPGQGMTAHSLPWHWAESVQSSVPISTTTTSGAALPLSTGSIRNYRYYQTQVYGSDTWKVTPHLTLTYGLNYQYFSVPYEKNGLETAQTSLVFDNFIATRVAQSAAGATCPECASLS